MKMLAHGVPRGAAILLLDGLDDLSVLAVNTRAFQTLDLSPFGYERIPRNEPFLEEAVI
ncbi:hypothetical protein LJR234_006454 [Mesorhizobium amorphae]|uniref:hypothetical protein n=1 Tax=Mesorhizobium amorphae TaxID=71433 RepID=UPI003ECCC46F